jgi:ribonuclease-3
MRRGAFDFGPRKRRRDAPRSLLEVRISDPDEAGTDGPQAEPAAGPVSRGEGRAPREGAPARRRRRGGRGRGRSGARAAPGTAAAEPAELAPPPPVAVAPRSTAPRPAAPRATDDEFGADIDAPAPREASSAPSGGDAPPADGAAPRRRRGRRGGRGRRRPAGASAPTPAVDVAAAEAVDAHEASALDDFGALEDAPAPATPSPVAPAEPTESPERREPMRRRDSPSRRDRPNWPERAGRQSPSSIRDGAPPPRSGPLTHPSSVQDWFSPERLDACQRAIGYYFRDISLLENALTHSSIKTDDRPSYERMEFLGDSVIGLVIASYLYDRRPDFDEGELTKIKSAVVSTDGLADAARKCGLDRFLAVGRGILMKDTVPKSLVADVFEGVVGAVYLDRGYEAVRLYVLDLLHSFIDDALSDGASRNFKSVLQQVAQRDFGDTPYYDVLRESGPEHSRVFEVAAVVGKHRFAVARAPTKKEAEQAAAKLALQTILLDKSSRKTAPRRRRPR